MPELLDDVTPDTPTSGRSMMLTYLAVVIVEAIVLACLWWMTVHFGP